MEPKLNQMHYQLDSTVYGRDWERPQTTGSEDRKVVCGDPLRDVEGVSLAILASTQSPDQEETNPENEGILHSLSQVQPISRERPRRNPGYIED